MKAKQTNESLEVPLSKTAITQNQFFFHKNYQKLTFPRKNNFQTEHWELCGKNGPLISAMKVTKVSKIQIEPSLISKTMISQSRFLVLEMNIWLVKLFTQRDFSSAKITFF